MRNEKKSQPARLRRNKAGQVLHTAPRNQRDICFAVGLTFRESSRMMNTTYCC